MLWQLTGCRCIPVIALVLVTLWIMVNVDIRVVIIDHHDPARVGQLGILAIVELVLVGWVYGLLVVGLYMLLRKVRHNSSVVVHITAFFLDIEFLYHVH